MWTPHLQVQKVTGVVRQRNTDLHVREAMLKALPGGMPEEGPVGPPTSTWLMSARPPAWQLGGLTLDRHLRGSITPEEGMVDIRV